MSFFSKIRWSLIGISGKMVLWVWHKFARIKVVGEESYQNLRKEGKPVIILTWHGRIFILPYFFRKRGIMPLISPSEDGEIAAQIMSRWGYRILRGSSSHLMVKAWNVLRKELQSGGEVIIVSDGPRGPNRQMKVGGIKLAQLSGSYLIPFSFSASKKKFLNSWDNFLLFYPFSRVVAMFGEPVKVVPQLSSQQVEEYRLWLEKKLIQLDKKADRYFDEN